MEELESTLSKAFEYHDQSIQIHKPGIVEDDIFL